MTMSRKLASMASMSHVRFVAGLGDAWGLGVLAMFAFYAFVDPMPGLPDGFTNGVGHEYEAQVAFVKQVAAEPCRTAAVSTRTPFGSGMWLLTDSQLEEGIWTFDLAMPAFGEFLTMDQQEALDQYLGRVAYASPGQTEWPADDAHRDIGLCFPIPMRIPSSAEAQGWFPSARMDGGSSPRAQRRSSRPHPHRPLRPGDKPQPEHRTARLAEDPRPAT